MVLDNVILRPSSTPPSLSPAARPLAPPAAAAAAVAAPIAVADMEVDGPALLSAVPLNQQRKEAIRAKQASGVIGLGSGGAVSLPPPQRRPSPQRCRPPACSPGSPRRR